MREATSKSDILSTVRLVVLSIARLAPRFPILPVNHTRGTSMTSMTALEILVGEFLTIRSVGGTTQQIAEMYDIPVMAVELLVGVLAHKPINFPHTLTPEQRLRCEFLAKLKQNEKLFVGEDGGWSALASC